jgi:hypothetical protein
LNLDLGLTQTFLTLKKVNRMAIEIKKVTIPPQDLKEIDWDSESYLIRYRIKTENKNLSSHWSPVYSLPVGFFPKVQGDFYETVSESGKILVNVVWDDFLNFPLYDIFVAFDGGEKDFQEFLHDENSFYYHGSSQNHNYSFVKRTDANAIRVIVQPSTNIKKIKERFIIFDSKNLI